MAKKRTRSDIVADMLTSIQEKGGKIKPTHLMYNSNLSHVQMNSYLDDLIEKDFVKKIRSKENFEYIIITDNGNRFLEKLREIKEFENAFGL